GLDQAILRMERELPKHSAKMVLFGMVPETICRVHSYWKHYSEYGNTFAFKPRFTLDSNKNLVRHMNPVNSIERFINYRNYLPELKKLDYFYKEKFLYDLLRFPFTFHLIRSWRRNIPLILALLHARFSKDDRVQRNPFEKVLYRNHILSADLYANINALDLMEALVKYAAEFVRKEGAEPVYCLLPQLQDIKIMRKRGFYCEEFLTRTGKYMKVIDLCPHMKDLDSIQDYYVDDMWGGHPSVKANELIGQIIAQGIKDLL
ncbi:MAG: hypothetical protein ABIA63_11320, partial [bacterium]